MEGYNAVRSLVFWRRVRPELFAKVKAGRLEGQNCPVCQGSFPYLTVSLPDGSVERNLHCLCLCPEIEAQLEALVVRVNDVPQLAQVKTFDQLKKRGTAEEWLSVRKAAGLLTEIASRPFDHRWLLLWGAPGCGKSHLLMAAQALLPNLCAYVYADVLSKRLHSALNDNSLPELEDTLVNLPVLIIDDLGAEHSGSEFAKNEFTNIINRRYMEGTHRPTIVATNLGKSALYSRYPRLASRLLDNELVDYVAINLWDYRRFGTHRPTATEEAASEAAEAKSGMRDLKKGEK